MTRPGRRPLGGALVAALGLGAAACGAPASIPDNPGYVGTWARGAPVRSFVYISRDARGEYRFRLGVSDPDGAQEMRCDWEGNCLRLVSGQRAGEYRFRPRVDEQGVLLVEYDAVFEGETTHYVDRLVVEPDGRTLKVFTVERDGRRFERGQAATRVFERVSDDVPGAPEGAS